MSLPPQRLGSACARREVIGRERHLGAQRPRESRIFRMNRIRGIAAGLVAMRQPPAACDLISVGTLIANARASEHHAARPRDRVRHDGESHDIALVGELNMAATFKLESELERLFFGGRDRR